VKSTVKPSPHAYPQAEVDAVYRAIRERRDVRHFRPGPIEPAQLARFVAAAHQAPSVGLMQPWRFIRIADPALRGAIHAHVEAERIRTAEALEKRAEDFMRLKVEGILDCGEVLVVALMDKRTPYVFGRRTMPQMDLASASCAIQNFWLAARAEGIGVGWVSLFDPAHIRTLCAMPDDSLPIAVLCVGHVDAFYPAPMLEMEGWDRRHSVEHVVYEDSWGQAPRDPG
jgi:5,6-dimethylbenzimidazole synthase